MLVPISIALLSLSAGMLLLAKTKKDNLGGFFKPMSLFIISASFLIMALSIAWGFARMLMHHERGHRHMNYGERGRWHHRSFHKHYHEHAYRDMEDNESHRMERDRNSEEMHGSAERPDNSEENHWPQGRMHHGFGRHGQRLSEQLNLSPEQTQKLQDIMKTYGQKAQELRAKNTGDPEQLKKQMQENRQAKADAIKKILTPAQLKLFTEKEQAPQHYDQ